MREYLQTAQEVVDGLQSHPERGLAADEAQVRLERDGLNKLKDEEKIPLWRRFVEQMSDPMVIMLIVAAAISAISGAIQGESEIADVIIILLVVGINAVLGIVQEAKSEEALAALQEMSAAQSKVIRDGKLCVLPSAQLVVGDVILLEAGDSVPADCRVLESASLKIEEAALTGESVPVEKQADQLALEDGQHDVTLGDRKNMCYMGSVVVYGRGRAVVTQTAMDTEMGKIAGALQTARDELTPLQIKLAQLSKILTMMVIAICIVIFAVGFLRHGSEFIQEPKRIIDTFMVAVSLAVAAIPEGLVAVVTIVLSLGVTKMSHRHAIIRKLTAVETLGCTQIICSDKTGTLTQNKMTVVRHVVVSDENYFIKGMALCCDATYDEEAGEAQGEPTECALVNDAAKAGLIQELTTIRRVAEAPFDSSRKMMTVLVEDSNGIQQFTKGAPDVILARCTHEWCNGEVVALTEERKAEIVAANKSLADEALRVLALACRTHTEVPAEGDILGLEQDLIFCGLSGMIDPVRPEVADAIAEARQAGIRPVMITGDHRDTAVAIAKELGIITDGSEALTGAELDEISDEDFIERVVEFSVYARVQPEHKTRIVDAWKARGCVVAMTGDGVNDAPSIKRADIGVGMGITGTDVTKNVADMVLADDNFATIISAVEEGRRIYDNIRKFIQFLLSANLAEVFSVFIATMVGFTIFQPVQLLWINLITDTFPALSLGMEEAEGDVMKREPRSLSEGVFSGGMGIDCVFQGIIITILVFVAFFAGVYMDMGYINIADMVAGTADEVGVTMAFFTLSMVEIFHSFNIRSRRASLFTMKKQNLWLWGAAVAALLSTIAVIEIDVLAELFGFVQLEPLQLGLALLISASIIPIMEVYKVVMRAIEK